MRAIILSVAVIFGLGSVGYAQDQLKGVYAPPGSSALGAPSPKASSGLSGPNVPVGGAPRVTVAGDPVQGQTLPPDVIPSPMSDRPGYGRVVINGRRAIVDLNTNRIVQLSD